VMYIPKGEDEGSCWYVVSCAGISNILTKQVDNEYGMTKQHEAMRFSMRCFK